MANALSLYIEAITDSDVLLTDNNTLKIKDIDDRIRDLNITNFTLNSRTSFIMVQTPIPGNTTRLGGSFIRGSGGTIVKNNDEISLNNSQVSAAAIINNESLANVTSLHMFIIDKPTAYMNMDKSTNKTLASSLIIVSVKRNHSSPTITNISLYFQVLNESKPNITNVDYYCSFYNTTTSQWSESGCTTPIRNEQFDRYECSCNHLTTFVLLSSPQIISCQNSTHTTFPNGTCALKPDVQV